MKKSYSTLLFIFAALPITGLHANEMQFYCSNQQFLKTPIELVISEREASFTKVTEDKECILDLDTNEEQFIPIMPEVSHCQLTNFSRPNQMRKLIALDLMDKVTQGQNGYIRITLDNRFADYGPATLTSFLYCRN